jgi:hypothetical protein
MVVPLTERRAVLMAALGILELRGTLEAPGQQPSEVAPLRRWLDNWNGVRAVITGMERQGFDVSLTRYPQGWRSTFLARDHTTRPWMGQVLSFHRHLGERCSTRRGRCSARTRRIGDYME